MVVQVLNGLSAGGLGFDSAVWVIGVVCGRTCRWVCFDDVASYCVFAMCLFSIRIFDEGRLSKSVVFVGSCVVVVVFGLRLCFCVNLPEDVVGVFCFSSEMICFGCKSA